MHFFFLLFPSSFSSLNAFGCVISSLLVESFARSILLLAAAFIAIM